MTLENQEKVSFLRKFRENLENSGGKIRGEIIGLRENSGNFFWKVYMYKINLNLKYMLPVTFLRNHMKFSALDSMYLITIGTFKYNYYYYVFRFSCTK